MKRISGFLLLVLIITLMTNFTFAEKVSIPNVGIDVEIPEGWNLEIDQEEGGCCFILDPDEEISISVSSLDVSNLKKALKKIEEEFFTEFEEVVYSEKKEIEINGFNALQYTCDLSSEDEFDGVMMFLLIESPKKDIVFLYSVFDREQYKKYSSIIKKIYNSLKASE